MKTPPILSMLLLLASGCTSLERTFYVDGRFTPAEEQEIAEAATAWETATGGAIRFDLAFGAVAVGTRESRRREIVRFTPEEANASEFSGFRDLTIPGTRGPAVTQPGESFQIIAVVPDLLFGWTLRTVIAHELGHAIGLHHVPSQDALMSFKPIRAIERFAAEGCLSHADVQEMIRYDIDTTRARECEP